MTQQKTDLVIVQGKGPGALLLIHAFADYYIARDRAPVNVNFTVEGNRKVLIEVSGLMIQSKGNGFCNWTVYGSIVGYNPFDFTQNTSVIVDYNVQTKKGWIKPRYPLEQKTGLWGAEVGDTFYWTTFPEHWNLVAKDVPFAVVQSFMLASSICAAANITMNDTGAASEVLCWGPEGWADCKAVVISRVKGAFLMIYKNRGVFYLLQGNPTS